MAGRGRLRQRLSRIPGVRRAYRWGVHRVRHSSGARAAVKRVFAMDTTASVPLDVAPGNLLARVGTESLPVTLVIIIGADAETIERTVDEIAELQVVSAGFRPVIVTDRPVFRAMRRYGYPAELLVPEEDWNADDQGLTWHEYARARIALLFSTYRASASLSVGPEGLDAAARLLLSSLRSATS